MQRSALTTVLPLLPPYGSWAVPGTLLGKFSNFSVAVSYSFYTATLDCYCYSSIQGPGDPVSLGLDAVTLTQILSQNHSSLLSNHDWPPQRLNFWHFPWVELGMSLKFNSTILPPGPWWKCVSFLKVTSRWKAIIHSFHLIKIYGAFLLWKGLTGK